LSDMMAKHLNQDVTISNTPSTFEYNEALDIGYLKQAYADDYQYALEMFQTFIEIIDDEMLLLKVQIEEMDKEKLKRQLHKIKPTFTMVGLGEYSKMIEDLEGENSLLLEELINWFSNFENRLSKSIPVIKCEIEKIQKWLKN